MQAPSAILLMLTCAHSDDSSSWQVNITDDNPGNKHFNTDGIDPNSCSNVLIEDYYYCGGDDAIAIKSGWNVAGMLYARLVTLMTHPLRFPLTRGHCWGAADSVTDIQRFHHQCSSLSSL